MWPAPRLSSEAPFYLFSENRNNPENFKANSYPRELPLVPALMTVSLTPQSFIFRRFAQMEMTKYQLQASDKWGFDFVREAPIAYPNSQFKWESSKLSEIPKFYHHIAHPARLAPRSSGAASFYPLFGGCENICPITQSISATSMIAQNPSVVNKRKIGVASSSASTSFEPSAACSHQRKITGRCCAHRKAGITASLWLITPKSDLKTINSHQILIQS